MWKASACFCSTLQPCSSEPSAHVPPVGIEIPCITRLAQEHTSGAIPGAPVKEIIAQAQQIALLEAENERQAKRIAE